MTARALAGVGLATLLLAGCGSGQNAGDVVSSTAENLGKIQSGRLHMLLAIQPARGSGKGIAVALDGPFALRGTTGPLPLAEVRYRQSAGDQQTSATLISTGRQAFVRVNDSTYRLPARDARVLQSVGSGRAGLSVADLHVDRWIDNPRLSHPSPGTDRVTGELDAVAAMSDLLRAARQAGGAASGGSDPITASDARRLRSSVRKSRVVLTSEHDGALLRDIHADAIVDLPPQLQARFGRSLGVRLRFELAVARPNEPVKVATPTNVQSRLPRR